MRKLTAKQSAAAAAAAKKKARERDLFDATLEVVRRHLRQADISASYRRRVPVYILKPGEAEPDEVLEMREQLEAAREATRHFDIYEHITPRASARSAKAVLQHTDYTRCALNEQGLAQLVALLSKYADERMRISKEYAHLKPPPAPRTKLARQLAKAEQQDLL